MKYLGIICLGWLIFSWGAVMSRADDAAGGSSVEVIMGGKRYDSLKRYREEEAQQAEDKITNVPQSAVSAPDNETEDRQMFDQAMHDSKDPSELTFDPAKMKTLYIQKPTVKPAPATALRTPASGISGKDPFTNSYQLLNQLGFDSGIHKVVSEFAIGPRRESKVVNTKELEKVLRNSFGDSNQPLLLISDHNNVRVMTLEPSGDDHSTDDSSNGSAKQ